MFFRKFLDFRSGIAKVPVVVDATPRRWLRGYPDFQTTQWYNLQKSKCPSLYPVPFKQPKFDIRKATSVSVYQSARCYHPIRR